MIGRPNRPVSAAAWDRRRMLPACLPAWPAAALDGSNRRDDDGDAVQRRQKGQRADSLFLWGITRENESFGVFFGEKKYQERKRKEP